MFLSDKLKWHLVTILEDWDDPLPWKNVTYGSKGSVWSTSFQMKTKMKDQAARIH